MHEQIGVAPSCAMANADYNITVNIFAKDGLSDFNATGKLTHTTVGSHQAVQEVDATGSCVIGLGVTATSSVDVTVTSIFNGDPCPTAKTVAGIVEPKLP